MNKYKNINKKIIIIVIIGILAIIFYLINTKNEASLEVTNLNEISEMNENNTNDVNVLEKQEEKNEIIVHITGAVKQEGVYKLEENSRITDVVNLAGGLREDADMGKINLAEILEDGMKINIPSVNDKLEDKTENTADASISQNTNVSQNVNTSQDASTSQSASKSKKININTASIEELDTLPGIGEATAKKIIEYRIRK